MNLPKHMYLFAGLFAFIFAMVVLFAVRLERPELLDIDAKWLVVASVPLLIALIAGRYIRSFKGGGIEFEVAANKAIMEDLPTVDLADQPAALEKDRLVALQSVSDEEKVTKTVLGFRKKINFYTVDGIRDYLRVFQYIKFFQVSDEGGRFLFLVYVKNIKKNEEQLNLFLTRFIEAVERGEPATVPADRKLVVSAFVRPAEGAIETLKTFERLKLDFLPVVNNDQKMVGIIFRTKLNAAIARQVLKQHDDE